MKIHLCGFEDYRESRDGAVVKSGRLPPMWPGFDSRTPRPMWVEFVVGSRSCSEGFSPGSPVFLPSQKPTFLNSNSTWNARSPLKRALTSLWCSVGKQITFTLLFSSFKFNLYIFCRIRTEEI